MTAHPTGCLCQLCQGQGECFTLADVLPAVERLRNAPTPTFADLYPPGDVRRDPAWWNQLSDAVLERYEHAVDLCEVTPDFIEFMGQLRPGTIDGRAMLFGMETKSSGIEELQALGDKLEIQRTKDLIKSTNELTTRVCETTEALAKALVELERVAACILHMLPVRSPYVGELGAAITKADAALALMRRNLR